MAITFFGLIKGIRNAVNLWDFMSIFPVNHSPPVRSQNTCVFCAKLAFLLVAVCTIGGKAFAWFVCPHNHINMSKFQIPTSSLEWTMAFTLCYFGAAKVVSGAELDSHLICEGVQFCC